MGVKVGVLNFPFRSPYPLHGFVVPGTYPGPTTTYPPGIKAEIQDTIGEEYPPELPVYRDSTRAEWIATATKAVEQRGKVAATLATRHQPGFLFALFRETDRVEHQLWSELSRPAAEIPEDLLTFWRTVDRACEQVDRAFRAGGGPVVTLVISDHGHGAIQSDFLTNRWLAEERFLVFRGGVDASRRKLLGRLLLYAQKIGTTPTVMRPLVDFVRDGRRARIAEYLGGGTSFEQFSKRIDWQRTVAFSYPVPEGIYLNPHNPDLTPERRESILGGDPPTPRGVPRRPHRGHGPEDDLPRSQSLAGSRAPHPGRRTLTEPRMDFGYPNSLIRERPDYFCVRATTGSTAS